MTKKKPTRAKSSKAKGGRFERYLLDRLRTEVDAGTVRTPGSGAGLDKGDLRIPNHEITIEAKNAKQLNILHWWKQAKQETFYDDHSILAVRNPALPEFKETFILMELETFIELLKNQDGLSEVIETLDPADKVKVRNTIEALKQTIKIFEKYEA